MTFSSNTPRGVASSTRTLRVRPCESTEKATVSEDKEVSEITAKAKKTNTTADASSSDESETDSEDEDANKKDKTKSPTVEESEKTDKQNPTVEESDKSKDKDKNKDDELSGDGGTEREKKRNELLRLKVPQLKDMCKEQSLHVGGRKEEIVTRLLDDLGLEPLSTLNEENEE